LDKDKLSVNNKRSAGAGRAIRNEELGIRSYRRKARRGKSN